LTFVTVVHLARHANGPEAFRRFIDSYLSFPPGVAHELLVICKGYARPEELRPDLERTGRPFELFPISDDGFDIGAYVASAKSVRTAFVCMLNSHSTACVSDWLAKLMDAVRLPGIGVAGATGSWESTFSGVTAHAMADWRSVLRRPRHLIAAARLLAYEGRTYPPWPNPHVRTNAFVLETRRFRGLVLERNDRRSALIFESGYRSMTRQLARHGLESVLVGADGRIFERDHWPESGTFRSGRQANLLIQDNQTRRYEQATDAERERLGRLAWGDRYVAASQKP
jgi:hypothetical protein